MNWLIDLSDMIIDFVAGIIYRVILPVGVISLLCLIIYLLWTIL